jgi:HAE1 family hydrophobic/amphiphilic exporter-1
VLVAVFVPVAFFPGTTGRLYQQFSLTIAFAVVLSVFNAMTLTPALAALLLDKESAHAWPLLHDGQSGDRCRHVGLRRHRAQAPWPGSGRCSWSSRWASGPRGASRSVVPTAFVPEEDEGFFITVVQAPAGASLEYTDGIAKQVEQILYNDPDIASAFSVMGFSFSAVRRPNNGMLVVTALKSYDQRQRPDQSLAAVLNRLRGPLFGISGAIVVPFAPPAIQGLSVFGGFQFEVLDQSGGDIAGLADATNGRRRRRQSVGQGGRALQQLPRQRPAAARGHRPRQGARLGLPLREVTDALQVFLGSQYINDFDFNSRAYRVFAQADQRFRASPDNLKQLYARTTTGQMVSLDTVVRVSETTAPQVISHFNLFRSAEITGVAAPGLSSGEGIAAMEQVARQSLPPGFDFAWAGQSLEEIKAGSQATYIFALSVLLVYLVLAAQYESWVLPIIILLGVPLAVLGAPRRAVLARGSPTTSSVRSASCCSSASPRRTPSSSWSSPNSCVRKGSRSWTRRSKPRASACGRFS